jgi:tRNA 2-thiouridine synthesizing protein A
MPPKNWSYTGHYDGGDKGCGELLLELRLYFQTQPPGAQICVITQDVGAILDLPAWCRMTGHMLLEQQHPFYLIQKSR